MLIVLKLFVLLLVTSIPAIESAKNYGPLYLSTASSQEAHLETEFVALDQCTRWGEEQLRHNSFALKFQLTGKCENGLLICYPGALDPSGANSAYGMRPEIHFQVQNHPQSVLGVQCLEHQKKCHQQTKAVHCNAKQIWHGVKVSAPNTSHGDILLELSISKLTYNLGTNRQFSIEFGNPDNLMTTILDENGMQIMFVHDDSIRDAYLGRKVKKNVLLSNYVGLWMLGLDFLPMHMRETLQLHVYRDCSCEMHAWFVHPSDEVPSHRVGHPEVSADCPETIGNAAAEQFGLPAPVNRDKSIRLRQRLNKKPSEVVLSFSNEHQQKLLQLQLENPPYGIIRIISNETGVLNEETLSNASKKVSNMLRPHGFKSMDIDDGSSPDGLDKYLEVEVVPRKYFYEVKIGDRKVFNYFPMSSGWWTKGRKENITRVEIAGDVYPGSVDVPKVDEKPNQSVQPAVNSYVTRFDELLVNGDQIVIRGQIGKPQNSKKDLQLIIGLLHNTPGFDERVSTMAWYLKQEHDNLTMGHYNPKDMYVKHQEAQLDIFKSGEAFEMRIELVEANNHTADAIYEFLTLVISVFTPSRTSQTNFSTQQLNFRDVNFIMVQGNLELFTDPFISAPDQFFEKNKQLSWDVYPLLVVGDSIFIEGKLRNNATFLQINLLHDANEQNPYVGDLVMQIGFNFTGNGTIQMKTWAHELTFLPIKMGDAYPSRLFPGEQFKIEIRVAFDQYNIFIYGALAANYFHVLPPWAVDYMNVNGHFSHITKFAVNRTNGTFCAPEKRTLDVPFVMEVPEQKMLTSNDSIIIHGIVTKNNAKISVLLLNEAVETYDNVPPSVTSYKNAYKLTMLGKIITRADFFTASDGKGWAEFSYFAGHNKYEGIQSRKFEPALTSGQKFRLKIRMRHHFTFQLDGYQAFVYTRGVLPAWAIQYIRIEGDLKLSKKPSVEFGSETPTV
uniref:Galectin domain-containing protein n=1 Tax=Globodera rostochiensis TaxID=31243 RepID=A0A914HLX4_GLORO